MIDHYYEHDFYWRAVTLNLTEISGSGLTLQGALQLLSNRHM